jgi:hypothetical protein
MPSGLPYSGWALLTRVTRYLERQGLIIKDADHDSFQQPLSDDDLFTRLQASSVTYRFATGPRKGQKAFVLKSERHADSDHNASSGLVVKNSGFSLHAGVATKATERDKLERIARYIARPAVSEERLSTNAAGDVIYRFKKPWGKTLEQWNRGAEDDPAGVHGKTCGPGAKTPGSLDKIFGRACAALQIPPGHRSVTAANMAKKTPKGSVCKYLARN